MSNEHKRLIKSVNNIIVNRVFSMNQYGRPIKVILVSAGEAVNANRTEISQEVDINIIYTEF